MNESKIRWIERKARNRHIFSRYRFQVRYLLLPLILLFSVADFFYAPKLFSLWLLLRIIFCVFTFFTFNLFRIKKIRDRFASQIVIALISLCTYLITLMIAQTGGVNSIYVMGLVLITFTGSALFQLNRRESLILNFLCYLPASIILTMSAVSSTLISTFIYLIFFSWIVVVDYITKSSLEKSRLENIRSKFQIQEESKKLSYALKELKATQEELIDSARMAALGTLAAGVSHEINNSMNFIYQSIPILKKMLSDVEQYQKKKDKVLEILGIMQEGVQRSVDIVKALRAQSRSDAGGVKAFNVYEALQNTLALLASPMKIKKISVELKVSKELEAMTYLGVFNQTVTNLLTNAFDASPTEGQVEIQVQLLQNNKINGQTQELLQLMVRDQGVGMSVEIQRQIFDPFFSTKGPQHGNGLGLYIVKKSLHQVEGNIRVMSKPGGPTEFIVQLPIVQNEEVHALNKTESVQRAA